MSYFDETLLQASGMLKPMGAHCLVLCLMVVADCVELLEMFHSTGFVHCDVKPDNIMLNYFRN